MRVGVVVALVTLLGTLGACGSDESEPSLSDSLTDSTWVTAQRKTIEFRDDGMYGVSVVAFEDVTEADREWGTWSVDGDELSMTPDPESPFCAEVTGVYTVAVLDSGDRLDATVQEDACGPRQDDFSLGLTRQADPDS